MEEASEKRASEGGKEGNRDRNKGKIEKRREGARGRRERGE